jgi:hypothetical protein
MRPIAAPRSSGLCMGSEHVDVRRVPPSADSFGSQIPSVFLRRIGQLGHECRTSRRPWAFVEEGECSLAETNDQWDITSPACDPSSGGSHVLDRDSTYTVGTAVGRVGAEVRDVAACCHNPLAAPPWVWQRCRPLANGPAAGPPERGARARMDRDPDHTASR